MRTIKAFSAVAITMVILDIAFLGYLARDFYDEQLGPLRGENVLWAATLFYLQYVAVITWFAVLPSPTTKHAALRGLGIGWLAYATFEFTNMAVIAGWPAALVPFDIAWGLVLTATVACAGRFAAGPPPHSES